MLRLLMIVILCSMNTAFASEWRRVYIPGAYCGNGGPYSIFINLENKNPDKLLIEFMGGGACWSKSTCVGPTPKTWIYPIPNLQFFSHFNSNQFLQNRFENFQKIYLPYCTGDVYASQHIAKYDGKKIYHVGKRNVYLALKYLHDNRYLNFSHTRDIVLYGASAGAIGTLFNLPLIEKLVPQAVKRTVIADAPGLHFGKTFWEKFPEKFIKSFKSAFKRVGLNFYKGDGFVAKQFPNLCQKFSKWNFGILQGARDIVMANIFGEISAEDHEAYVYSENGLYENTKTVKNCSVWAPRTRMHTFLLTKYTARNDYIWISAEDFTDSILSGHTDRNYQ